MICAIMLAIPDLSAGAAQGWGVFYARWTRSATVLKDIIYLGILVAQLLCGLATVTSASRMLFAFSRDEGMPAGSKALASVSPRFRTPVAANRTSAIFCIITFSRRSSSRSAARPLHHRGELDAGVPVPVIHHPIMAGMFAYGGPKWPTPGPGR